MMNTARLTTYYAMREEIVLYVETRTGARMKSEYAPRENRTGDDMDVDAFVPKGKGKKGKGKGKDSKGKGRGGGTHGGKGADHASSKFEGECRNCGKYGHMAKDCWHKDNKTTPKGDGKGKKGKGKGKSKQAGSFDEQPEQEAGGLDMSSVSCSTNSDWVKCNYDTGCARSVVPLTEGEPVQEGDGTTYRTASGETIEDQGEAILRGHCEHGVLRKITARRADVHKVLVAGSAAAKFQDAWITKGGGYLVPRSSPIAKGLEKELHKLIKKYGDKNLIQLYEENGVYNFYLRRESSRAGGEEFWKEVPGGRKPGFHRQPRA